jgi:hypothetical protein
MNAADNPAETQWSNVSYQGYVEDHARTRETKGDKEEARMKIRSESKNGIAQRIS